MRVVLILFAALLLSCQQATPPIRIGLNPWPGYEYLYLAEQIGAYEQFNLNVRVFEYSSLDDVRFAFESSQIDLMASTFIEQIIASHNISEPVQSVLYPDYSNGGDQIIAHGEIESIKQLKGLRIGVEPASLGIFILTRALQLHDLKISDVKIIALDQPNMVTQFKLHNVDAIVTYTPFANHALEKSESKILFDSSLIPFEIIDTVSAKKDFIEKHSDEMTRLLQVWDYTLQWAEQNSQQANAIMAERHGIREHEYKNALMSVSVLTSSEQKQLVEKESELIATYDLAQKTLYAQRMIPTVKNSNMYLSATFGK